MERQEQILATMQEILAPRLQDKIRVTLQSIAKNEYHDENLMQAMDKLFQNASKQQEQGKKGPIAFCVCSLLYSSVLMKTYDLRIDLYDKDFYLDETETSVQWHSPAYKDIDLEIQTFSSVLRKQLIRVRDFEVEDASYQYALYHNALTLALFTSHINDFWTLKSYQSLLIDNKMDVFFGEYIGETVLLTTSPKEMSKI